jgi:thiol:disulfide interchange protein
MYSIKHRSSKTIALLVSSLFCSMQLSAQIRFTNSTFDQALALAKKTHKNVFVDAYATWCAPCKQLKDRTFKDAAAAAYFNRHFINVSIDVEKGEGEELAKQWQIEGLPTLLIINSTGKVLANHTGFVDGHGLIAFSKETVGK